LGKIQYVYDNIAETAGTISHADYLSAMDLSSRPKVALFNVNYRRPYFEVTLAEASLLSCSAAPVVRPLVLLSRDAVYLYLYDVYTCVPVLSTCIAYMYAMRYARENIIATCTAYMYAHTCTHV